MAMKKLKLRKLMLLSGQRGEPTPTGPKRATQDRVGRFHLVPPLKMPVMVLGECNKIGDACVSGEESKALTV